MNINLKKISGKNRFLKDYMQYYTDIDIKSYTNLCLKSFILLLKVKCEFFSSN